MSVPSISARDVAALLAAGNGPRLIDVREADEWAHCRIAGAEWLPLSQWPAIAGERLVEREQALIIYCHHGIRSARAADFLLNNGYTDVTNLAGGIEAWALEVDPATARY